MTDDKQAAIIGQLHLRRVKAKKQLACWQAEAQRAHRHWTKIAGTLGSASRGERWERPALDTMGAIPVDELDAIFAGIRESQAELTDVENRLREMDAL